MTNRLAVVLTGVAVLGLGTATAAPSRQVLPSDNTVTLVEEPTVKLSGEADLYKNVEEASPLDRKVSIRVSNVPISVFLNSITTQAKINFIMSEEFANKKVTASLTRVTVREALDTLLRVHGLAYQRIGKSDSYVVTKRSNDAPDTITKIYTLSYISLSGVGGGSGSASGELNSLLSPGSSGGDMGGGVGGGATSSGSTGGSDGASEITGIIKSMMSSVGRIATDPRTNKLIITDVPEVFPPIENILAELDVRPPQILIEAQIVEVNKSSGLNLGFEYGGSDGTLVSATGPSRTFDLDYVRGTGIKGWNYIFPKSDSSSSSSGGGSGGEGEDSDGDEAGVLNFAAFNIVLKTLLTRGEAKYLGKPKVVTLNNKTATITTSTDATVGYTQSLSGSGDTQMTTQAAERKQVGLTLQVTPQVNREGYVTLFVQPTYSDVISSGFENSKDTVTRAASTLVRVKNGQTVVIGGLLTSRETEQVRKVPLLGDIPILGWLFTSKTSTKSTTDLVIFITPTVLAE
jgi:type II secretory pathway component GspD/PulD (secretin)